MTTKLKCKLRDRIQKEMKETNRVRKDWKDSQDYPEPPLH